MQAIKVTEGLNLTARMRGRVQEQAELQRTARPHDIRGAIPLVDYTNPAKFPPYVFREYPKMPLLDGNRPIVVDESGALLTFFDAEDEADFMDANPELAEEIERNSPAKLTSNALASAQNEVEELRRKLMEAGIDPDAGKRRTAAPARSVSSLVRPAAAAPLADPEPTEIAPSGDEPSSELRDRVRAEANASASASKPGGNPLRNKKR